ncbi:DUF3027 domain-containing protein [Nocardia abscessus]|nr:DUF3027 domain-containing protein [Nocardia abscessus]
MRPILADAVDLARRALLELEPSGVGAHLGVIAEDESAATHRFEATLPGYRGWQWAVVVAAPPEADYATVSESALLPGPEALVAPEFVPWEQRVRPGDLAPGDLLAPLADDPRLVPGYVASGDPAVDEVAYEVGFGRTKVMSREGRAEAAERWYAEYGPDAEMAKAAPATCGSCGFYLPLAGALRAAFGVCGNAMGADGRVVHVAYGCGAHSDTEVPTGGGSPLYEAYDDAAIEVIPLETEGARAAEADTPAGGARRGAAEASSAPAAAEQPEDTTGTTEVRADAAVAEDFAVARQSADRTATAGAEVTEPGAAGVGEIDSAALAAESSVPSAGEAPSADDVAETSSESQPAEPRTAASGLSGTSVDETQDAGLPVTGDLRSANTQSDPVTDVEQPSAGSDSVQPSGAGSSASEAEASSADAPGVPESTPVAEQTGTENAGAQAGSTVGDEPGSEARPEFQSSPRS